MLLTFAVKNYRGFRNRIEWRLDKPSNFAFNDFAVRGGIIKNGLIYGPNGSGKSNFGLALFDIENHLSSKTKHPNYARHFLYGGVETGTADFEYTFQFGNNIVKYNYSKNYKGELVTEEMTVNSKSVFHAYPGHFDFDGSQFTISPSALRQIEERANPISIANYLATTQPLPSGHYLLELMNFVDSMLWFRCLGYNEFIGFETGVKMIDEYIISGNYLESFRKFLFEASSQDFELIPSTDGKTILARFAETSLPLSEICSTGTQALRLLFYWLTKLERVSLVFIDEFDAFYHIRLSKAVCKRVFEKACQGFMTTHNTSLLQNDLLRPDCNFILDKNTIASLPQLTEKELREGHNIEKLYRGNTFQI